MLDNYRVKSLYVLNGIVKNLHLSESIEKEVFNIFEGQHYKAKLRAIINCLRYNDKFLFDIVNNRYTIEQIITMTPNKINICKNNIYSSNQTENIKRKR